MTRLRLRIKSLFDDERGASAVEYALLAAVIGFGMTMALFAFQDTLYNVYVHGIAEKLGNHSGSN